MAATQLSRSTAFRLLRYLTEERMLEFDSQRRSYHVGPLAFELGLAARGPANLAAEWKDRLAKIAKRTDSTAYLVARANTDVVCLATEHAQSVVRAVSLVVGQRLPLGVGAGSLAILSLLPDVEVNSTIVANESRLRMYGDGRLTPRVLRQRIESTRAKGFAFSQDSVASGVIGIGITIPLRAELTQLAVSVSRAAKSMDVAERARLADLIRGIAKT